MVNNGPSPRKRTLQKSPRVRPRFSSCRPSRAQRRVLLAYLGLAPQAIISHASGVQNRVPYGNLFRDLSQCSKDVRILHRLWDLRGFGDLIGLGI